MFFKEKTDEIATFFDELFHLRNHSVLILQLRPIFSTITNHQKKGKLIKVSVVKFKFIREQRYFPHGSNHF